MCCWYQVRKLFVSLDKSRRGRLDDEAIGKLLEMLGEPALVVADKVVATRVEINGGDEDEDRVRPKPTRPHPLGQARVSLSVWLSMLCARWSSISSWSGGGTTRRTRMPARQQR